MPYYHNFGWYYFAKYILGLAGMIFLYTGILKEKSIVCPCPADQRERDRSKQPNNECSPTGDPTDAPAKAHCCVQTLAPVDVATKSVRCPASTKGKHVDKSVGTYRKNVRERCIAKESISRRETVVSISSSGRRLKIGNSDAQSQDNVRRSSCRRKREDSATNTNGTGVYEVDKTRGETRNVLLDAVAGANFRARNSFAEQEIRELEAFVRSIVDNEISQRCLLGQEKLSSSEVNSTTEMENSEDEEVRNSSSEMDNYPKRRIIRRRVNQASCKKHFPQSPPTSIASFQSRSGTPYFTASSRGKKRPECKIHGNRFRNKIETERSRRQLLRPRIIERSEDSEIDKKPYRRATGNRRKISSRRITRYRSSIVFT